jgi:hypothetical protein
MPAHLLSLREAIVSQGASEVIAEETGISKEAAERLAKVELSMKITAVSFLISKLDADYVQSVKDLEAKYSKKKGLKEVLKDMFLNSAEYVTEENELEADYKIERKKLIDKKAALQAEQAALESQPVAKETITKQRVRLKNVINDFSIDAQGLLNNPNPTIEEYEAVIGNYEFDLEAELPSEEFRAMLESQLEDIKNTFKITKPTSRKETIDQNFDNIVKQLAKAKINIFFNDKNEFKKC